MARAEDLCSFLDASPMPYQAVAECVRRLDAAGFTLLDEADAWQLQAGGGYYVIRASSTVVAFRVGSAAPADAGFVLVGAHTDSPNLRLKPDAVRASAGYDTLAVDVYGGAIIASWTDRDLGLAGRVVLRGGDDGSPRGGVTERFVNIRRPIARVANLAIHLNRTVNSEGLKLDKQRHLSALLGLARGRTLSDLLADELGADATDVLDFDLGLYDIQGATIGGPDGELLFSARLDNLASSHAALVALVEAEATSEQTRLIALFDHEECGSRSAQGADSSILADIVRRIAAAHPQSGGDPFESSARACARSLLVSADMSHALHPNYAAYHDAGRPPLLGRGPVIKRNDNQRYATDGESAAHFAQFCRKAGFEPQYYVHRSDLPCGSTIGPMSSALSGIKTVDVGNPMLSMHSAREMCGTFDHDLMIEAMAQLFGAQSVSGG